GVADEVQPGVVMVTTRSPSGELAAMFTVTVAILPAALMVGGLLTEMPMAGVKSMLEAEVRLLPNMFRETTCPAMARIGCMLRICGSGRVTRNWLAPGAAGTAEPVGSVTMTARSVVGAVGSMLMSTSGLPSPLMAKLPGWMVMPVAGSKAMAVAVARPVPVTVTFMPVVPVAPVGGTMLLMAEPTTTPTCPETTGPYCTFW